MLTRPAHTHTTGHIAPVRRSAAWHSFPKRIQPLAQRFFINKVWLSSEIRLNDSERKTNPLLFIKNPLNSQGVSAYKISFSSTIYITLRVKSEHI